MTVFPEKISIFTAKISDDLFFCHRPGFLDFPFLFPDFPYLHYVKCRICPFPHKKNHCKTTISDTFFSSVRTLARIRQHYSKYWGDGTPKIGGGGRPMYPSPPRSPPLKLRAIHL